jgi:hypothetical protein
LHGVRRRQTRGIGGIQVDDQADTGLGDELATADAKTANFDQPGQSGCRAHSQFSLVRPDMHAVIAYEPGSGNQAGPAGEGEVEGKARFPGTGRTTN